MFNFLKRKKKEKVKFTPKQPLEWWIDDLSHRVCALIDHPELGLDTLPWPDSDKVYIAIDKTEYTKVLEEAKKLLRESKSLISVFNEFPVDKDDEGQEWIDNLSDEIDKFLAL